MPDNQQDLKNIICNTELLLDYLNLNEIQNAATITELICLQLKIYLGHELFCTINKDSIKRLNNE